MSGPSLNPIISDLNPNPVACRAGEAIEIFDHYDIISSFFVSATRNDADKRSLWGGEDTRWPKIWQATAGFC